MARRVRIVVPDRRARGIKNPVRLADFGLEGMLSPATWLKTWRVLITRASDANCGKVEDAMDALRKAVVDSERYLNALVKLDRIIPPAAMSDDNTEEEADWCDQMHDQIFFLEQFSSVWSEVLLPLRDSGKYSAVLPVVYAYQQVRDGALLKYLKHGLFMWGVNRRDDIVGVMNDGYWPPTIRQNVIGLWTIATHLWNCNLVGRDSPYWDVFEYTTEKMTIGEWGRIYDESETDHAPSRLDLRLREWFLASDGLPLLPLHQDPTAARTLPVPVPVVYDEGDGQQQPQKTYPWKESTYVTKLERPWNRDVSPVAATSPLGKLPIGPWWNLLRRIWDLQDDLIWTPALEGLILISLWECGSRFVLDRADDSTDSVNSLMTEHAEGTDLTDLDKSRRRWMFRAEALMELERRMMHFSRLTQARWKLTRDAALSGCVIDAEERQLYLSRNTPTSKANEYKKYALTQVEANSWCAAAAAKVMSYGGDSTGAQVVRSAVATVALGYFIKATDLEEYIQTCSAIAIRAPLGVLNHTRSAEFRGIITVTVDPYNSLNTLTYACVSDNIALTKPETAISKETGVITDATLDSLRKYQLYHRMLPVVLREIVQMEELHRTAATVIAKSKRGVSSGGGMADAGPKVSGASVLEMAREFSKIARNYLADLERTYPGIKATVSGDDFVQEEAELARRYKASMDAAAGGSEQVPKSMLFQSRFEISHYALRSYTSSKGIVDMDYVKDLRGAVPPKSFSASMYGRNVNTAGSALLQQLLPPVESGRKHLPQPRVTNIRGEYWVYTPRKFFGRTRCCEQALKWYTLQIREWAQYTGHKAAYSIDPISNLAFGMAHTA